MPHRRDVLALAGAAGLSAFAGASESESAGLSRLRTRLFNFKDDVSPDKAAELVASLKTFAPGAQGFMAGRNFIPDLFPTRFEWMCMIQTAAETPDPVEEQLKGGMDALASFCRNQVECDLMCPLPAGYADAAGVGVRHTVMFDFKPGTTDEARTRNVDAIREMGKLPMVRSYLVQPGVGPPSDPIQMQWQVVGDFASVDDYRAYSAAPVHLAIREDFTANTSRVAFLDVKL